jgi:hypothetical protein
MQDPYLGYLLRRVENRTDADLRAADEWAGRLARALSDLGEAFRTATRHRTPLRQWRLRRDEVDDRWAALRPSVESSIDRLDDHLKQLQKGMSGDRTPAPHHGFRP